MGQNSLENVSMSISTRRYLSELFLGPSGGGGGV